MWHAHLARVFTGGTPVPLSKTATVLRSENLSFHTLEIAISVRSEKVECSINHKVVASYDKSALVIAGKRKSTDGVFI